jgi:hypothetical protein
VVGAWLADRAFESSSIDGIRGTDAGDLTIRVPVTRKRIG